jgi:hypothetical protein
MGAKAVPTHPQYTITTNATASQLAGAQAAKDKEAAAAAAAATINKCVTAA